MSVPTEDEIRAAAKTLGLVDEHGNYRQRDRNRIAAAIQQAAADQAIDLDPATGNTAQVLAAFRAELAAAGFAVPDQSDPTLPGTGAVLRLSGVGEQVLVEAARHLLSTAGLQLMSDDEVTTP